MCVKAWAKCGTKSRHLTPRHGVPSICHDGSVDTTGGAWDWDATATIIQAVATLVALGGVAATVILTRRGHKQDLENARSAEKAAEASAIRSENAAALTIDNMSRIAEALEDMAARATHDSSVSSVLAAQPPRRVSWSLKHHSGDKYLLENTGDATAYGVAVGAHESLITHGLPERQNVQPGEALTFIAARTMGTSDSTITVEWSTESDAESERDTWRYPLPPRPPRR